jgi:dipeptidyl aminopeptidase/acylaminoacyl peptidase
MLIEADPPSPLLRHSGMANLENLQSVCFISRGFRVAGWYLPSKNRASVVVAHGTNGDRAGMLEETRLLAAAGFGVLAFDWPGLGESQGPILWGAEARSALSEAINWLAARPDVDADRIGGLGFSMGGYVLTQVAAMDPRLRAVVIESAASDFDSYIAVHNSKWGFLSEVPAHWALRNSGLFTQQSASRVIGEISPRPLLIIAQTGDPETPESMTRTLYAAARSPKQLWLMKGSHHGGYAQAAGPEYQQRLRGFFEANLLSPGDSAR